MIAFPSTTCAQCCENTTQKAQLEGNENQRSNVMSVPVKYATPLHRREHPGSGEMDTIVQFRIITKSLSNKLEKEMEAKLLFYFLFFNASMCV